MTSDGEPDSDNLIVKAQYFAPIEVKENHLQNIQNRLTRLLRQRGYRQADADPSPFGPTQRTMDFRRIDGIPIEVENTIIDKVRYIFGFQNANESQEISKEAFLEGLEKARDDLPFRFVFYFKPYQDEDTEGYDVEVESIPVLLQKYRQLSVREDYSYNANNIVEENKREIKRIMGNLGLTRLKGPSTKAKFKGEESNSVENHALLDQYRVGNLLDAINQNDRLQQDYQKAVREFQNGEFGDSIRDIGRAGEHLVDLLCTDIYNEDDIPSNTAGKINKLDKSEDGIPSFVVKTISPLWWLRNKANHATEYEITEDDAHYALVCFQKAVKSFVEDYKDSDVERLQPDKG